MKNFWIRQKHSILGTVIHWNLLEYNISHTSIERAMDVTEPIVGFTNHTGGIDLGFMIMSSFGNGYRLLKRQDYLDLLFEAANQTKNETLYDIAFRYAILLCMNISEKIRAPIILLNIIKLIVLSFENILPKAMLIGQHGLVDNHGLSMVSL